MVINRRGASKIGCLFSTLVLAAVAYYGLKIGQVYYNASSYENVMKASVRVAEVSTDKQIQDKILAEADTLGLPDEAKETEFEPSPETRSSNFTPVARKPTVPILATLSAMVLSRFSSAICDDRAT